MYPNSAHGGETWNYKESELEYDSNLLSETKPRSLKFKKLLYCYDIETNRNIKIDILCK